jgi:hypothetical protein
MRFRTSVEFETDEELTVDQLFTLIEVADQALQEFGLTRVVGPRTLTSCGTVLERP